MKKILLVVTLLGFNTGYAKAQAAFSYFTSSITSVDTNIVLSTASGASSITLSDGTPIFGNFSRVLIGTSTIVGNSNAGIQYSALQQNRGQIRMNQFGNNAGTPGLTGFKSRGVDFSSMSPVSVNDELLRLNAIAVAPNSNIPIVGSFIIKAASATHSTSPGYVPTLAQLLLVNYQDAATFTAMSVDPYGSLNMASSGTFHGSLSATTLTGDGSNLTNMTVNGSSETAGDFSIASVTDVHVATMAVTLRGGRPGLLTYIVDTIQAVGTARDYTACMYVDGVLDDCHSNTTSGSGATGIILDIDPITTSAGTHYYHLTIKSSNATGTQTGRNGKISLVEF